jgi:hypothetical protein
VSDFWRWFSDEGVGLIGDIVIPTAAILIPTGIAVWLAARERAASKAGDAQARRLNAGGDVIVALAAMVSLDPFRHRRPGRRESPHR